MRRVLAILITSAVLQAVGAAQAAVIASDNFDSPLNLISYSAIDDEGNDPTNFGVWSSGYDNFGPRSVQDYPGPGPTGNYLSDAVVDDSINDGGDTIGIVTPQYPGKFFAIVDTDNNANPSGLVTGSWTFDISAASSLSSFQVDLGAMGDFYDDGSSYERFTWAYSIDGSPSADLIEVRGNASAGPVSYSLANGSMQNSTNGITANGTLVINELQTYSVPLAGAGSELTLTLTGFINDNAAALVADNIVINGTVIPEPASASLLAVCILAVLSIRRRER